MGLLGGVGKSIALWVGVDAVCANLWNSVLCSEMAVRMIDQPFISETDDKGEWAL